MNQTCHKLWTRPIRGTDQRVLKTGLEMEFHGFDSNTLEPLGTGSALHPSELIKRIHHLKPESKLVLDPHTQVTVGVMFPNTSNFSIEPGGQVEFSSSPHAQLAPLAKETSDALALLEEAAKGEVVFASHGTNPVSLSNMDLVLPKERYQILYRYYLSQQDGRGQDMMRYTASVQANVDVLGDENWNDAVNLTWMLTPFTRYLFSNSKFIHNKKSQYDSERIDIWDKSDPTRSGIPPHVAFAKDIPCAYAEWAQKANVFYVEGLPIHEQPLFGELNFQKWLNQSYKGIKPTLHHWEQHLGTLFPDLRIRGFLELRSADAQPFEHTLAVVAFWKAALQMPEVRKNMWDFLTGISRAYLSCYKDISALEFKEDKDAYLQLLAAPSEHSIFKDTKLHEQILSIAIQGLKNTKDDVGVESLESYQTFILQKKSYWESENGAEFLKKIVTASPSNLFKQNLYKKKSALG